MNDKAEKHKTEILHIPSNGTTYCWLLFVLINRGEHQRSVNISLNKEISTINSNYFSNNSGIY